VTDQHRDPDSRLNWMERLIRARKERHEFGWGDWSVIETEHPAVFAHACRYEDSTVIAVHNLAQKATTACLDLSDFPEGHLADLMGDQRYEPLEGNARNVDLDPYGYRWFHLDH
jgi:maltose alpha-D-glucosyltransferase/alpha-amylase